MFNCDKCGECCRNLNMSDIYSDLNAGDGTCKYLVGDLCSIYDDRPLKCRIEECYYAFFSDYMTIDEYYQMNYDMCKKLKKNKEV